MPSYQSRWILALAIGSGLLSASAQAEPYEDTQHRFQLQLVEGWQPTPAFGDTDGMVFTRAPLRRGGRSATLRVRVEPLGDPAQALARHAPVLAPGERLEARGTSSGQVGGLPSLTRSFRRGEGATEDQIVVHAIASAGRVYLLEAASPRRDQGRLAPELKQILQGFQAHAVEAQVAPLRPRLEGIDETLLAGRWQNSDGLVLALGADHSFALAEASGRYEIGADSLTLIIPGQGRESFTFAYDGAAGTLTLSSPNLDEPMVYRRMTPGKGRQPAPEVAAAAAGDDDRLHGRWATSGKKGAVHLMLGSDHLFALGSHQGHWSATRSTLRLDRGGSDVITYQYKLEDRSLVLSGGDLDAPVRFKRSK